MLYETSLKYLLLGNFIGGLKQRGEGFAFSETIDLKNSIE